MSAYREIDARTIVIETSIRNRSGHVLVEKRIPTHSIYLKLIFGLVGDMPPDADAVVIKPLKLVVGPSCS